MTHEVLEEFAKEIFDQAELLMEQGIDVSQFVAIVVDPDTKQAYAIGPALEIEKAGVTSRVIPVEVKSGPKAFGRGAYKGQEFLRDFGKLAWNRPEANTWPMALETKPEFNSPDNGQGFLDQFYGQYGEDELVPIHGKVFESTSREYDGITLYIHFRPAAPLYIT